MCVYYLDFDRKNNITAGKKAPKDISTICNKMGFKPFVFPSFPREKGWLYKKIWIIFTCTYYWIKLSKIVRSNDIIIYQHPMYGKRVAIKMISKIKRNNNCKFVAIIHDLESLRGGIPNIVKNNVKTNYIGDNHLLKNFDAIICHNNKMKQYMIEQGFNGEKIVCLYIFDYLTDFETKCIKDKYHNSLSIAVAGNLAPEKSGYIYKLCENIYNNKIHINLYGMNYHSNTTTNKATWFGLHDPDDLPQLLDGKFGLVWDGPSIITCEGNTGNYLKYNNPHKASLYIVSGLPVVVWEKAAIADFIVSNNVGIAISDLRNLESILSKITDTEYRQMLENVYYIGSKMKKGFYFKAAINKALQIIGN